MLAAGGVLNFVTSETIQFPISQPGPLLTAKDYRPRMDNIVPKQARAVMGVIMAALMLCFWWLTPLTYGTPV